MPRSSEPTMRNHVRQLRTTQGGMTQQMLADHVGVTRQTIIALEGEAYTPSLALALRIAKAFDRRVDEVFWLDD